MNASLPNLSSKMLVLESIRSPSQSHIPIFSPTGAQKVVGQDNFVPASYCIILTTTKKLDQQLLNNLFSALSLPIWK